MIDFKKSELIRDIKRKHREEIKSALKKEKQRIDKIYNSIGKEIVDIFQSNDEFKKDFILLVDTYNLQKNKSIFINDNKNDKEIDIIVENKNI
ncbi:hypothetical protein [Helicobacter trogontum]|uniref:Uncharacterized protein n=1 Tax=Helicobacter trogontum TaxID=50960 RepID=A0A4U8S213_9HELI|nr:hypothetical protein [Helicobacter trogontum]TLD79738.1 hypothetical protein LS81_010295 [Helicobacter trogontum]